MTIENCRVDDCQKRPLIGEIERLRATAKKAITLLEDHWRDRGAWPDKRLESAQDILYDAVGDEQSAPGDQK